MSWTYTDLSKEQGFTEGIAVFLHDFSITKTSYAILDAIGPPMLLLCLFGVLGVAGALLFSFVGKYITTQSASEIPTAHPSTDVLEFSGTIDRYGSWQETRSLFQLKEYPERAFQVGMGSTRNHKDRALHNSMLKEGDQVSFKVTAKELNKYQTPSVFDFKNHSYKGPALQ